MVIDIIAIRKLIENPIMDMSISGQNYVMTMLVGKCVLTFMVVGINET